MKIYIIFLIFIFSFLSSFSQKIEIGVDAGYVNSEITEIGLRGFQISSIIHIYPGQTVFHFNSGLSYQKEGLPYQEEGALNFIKFPLGIGFSPGRRLKFLLGLGLDLNYVFVQSNYTGYYNVPSARFYMLNFYFQLGASYNFWKYFSIYLKTQFDGGIMLFNSHSDCNCNGNNDYAHTFSINLGLSYLIYSKNK